MSAREIPPGGEGKIDITFSTGTRGGKRRKSIVVKTNDPGQKSVRLAVEATVKVVLATKPSRINFGRFKKGTKSLTRYVSLTGEEWKKVKILSAVSKNKSIKVETRPGGFAGDPEKLFRVTILPDIKPGRFRDRITIQTDHPTVKKLVVYVYGDATGNIIIRPTYLSFGMLQKGRAIEKKIDLRSADDARFRVLDVRSTVPELVTAVETVEDGKRYSVTARITDTFDKNLLKGKIIIRTDDSEQERIEVRVFGRAMKKPVKTGLQTKQKRPLSKKKN